MKRVKLDDIDIAAPYRLPGYVKALYDKATLINEDAPIPFLELSDEDHTKIREEFSETKAKDPVIVEGFALARHTVCKECDHYKGEKSGMRIKCALVTANSCQLRSLTHGQCPKWADIKIVRKT